jgi:hypothetical protein
MAKVQKEGSVTVSVKVPFVVTAEKAEMKAEFAAVKDAVAKATKIQPPKRLPMSNCKVSFPQPE